MLLYYTMYNGIHSLVDNWASPSLAEAGRRGPSRLGTTQTTTTPRRQGGSQQVEFHEMKLIQIYTHNSLSLYIYIHTHVYRCIFCVYLSIISRTIIFGTAAPSTFATSVKTLKYIYYIILYYTILYYTILYYTILYYTIPYHTILYYTILYYTILAKRRRAATYRVIDRAAVKKKHISESA